MFSSRVLRTTVRGGERALKPRKTKLIHITTDKQISVLSQTITCILKIFRTFWKLLLLKYENYAQKVY